jgi:solute carrier family 25 (mitochondrial carnitine/acylcarnitine transporter), member 20/29
MEKYGYNALVVQGLPSTEQLGILPLVVAGGLGGMACWIVVYPMDVIKSKLQLQSMTKPNYKGIWDCAKKVVAAEGMAGLYKGLGPCLARSFPANAAAFVAYEQTMRLVRSSTM